MRIALLHPTYWPEVRRGSERLVHDLGVELVAGGHDVTLLTTHADRASRSIEDGMAVVRSRRPRQLPERLRAEQFLADVPLTLLHLRREAFDVAHSFSLADSWAAIRARRFGGPPVVHSIHGVPTPTSLGSRRGRAAMLGSIGRRAAAVSVLSEVAAQVLRDQTGIDPVILPGGVRMQDFARPVARSSTPVLFCPASIGDPRKRVQLLVDCMPALRERMPRMRLLLTEGRDPLLSRGFVSVPDGVEVVDADDTAKLSRLYGEAWVTVLPSVDEAFGLVLIESLAAGTPVVAARSGASPEIVHDDSIGRMFGADDQEDLVRALTSTLELAKLPATAELCREEARRHDWSRVVERYEEVYRRAAGG